VKSDSIRSISKGGGGEEDLGLKDTLTLSTYKKQKRGGGEKIGAHVQNGNRERDPRGGYTKKIPRTFKTVFKNKASATGKGYWSTNRPPECYEEKTREEVFGRNRRSRSRRGSRIP